MSIVGWLLLGLVVGALANGLMPGRFPGGIFGAILGGVFGAFLGGALFSLLLDRDVSGFDVGSFVIAFLGGIGLLTLLHRVARNDDEPRFDRRARA